jgi:hypothetical protein
MPGSEGGAAQTNASSLPLSRTAHSQLILTNSRRYQFSHRNNICPYFPIFGGSYGNTVSVNYDYYKSGQVSQVVDGRGTHTYTYLKNGAVDDESLTGEYTLNRAPDSHGRLSSSQLLITGGPTLPSTSYTYRSSDGLYDKVEQSGFRGQYGYGARFHEVKFENGGSRKLHRQSEFKKDGSVLKVRNSAAGNVVGNFVYVYDDKGRRESVTHAVNKASNDWSYVYNDRDELKESSKALEDGSVLSGYQSTYSYDPIGNRISAQNGSAIHSYATASSSNQIQSVSRTRPWAFEVLGKDSSPEEVTLRYRDTSSGPWDTAVAPSNTSGHHF